MVSSEKKDVSSRKASRVSPRIKNQNLTTKIEPLQGHIEVRYLRCGRSNCKCAKGELHGPYNLRRWIIRGQRRSEYVKKGDVLATKAACEKHKREQRQARQQWREALQILRTFKSHLFDLLSEARL
jgi:hypothetical protein